MTKLTQCQTALLTYLKTILLALCAVASVYPALSQALTFTDDFNRPDSPTVGNGWSDTAGNVGGNLEILNNELTCTAPIGQPGAGIFRPFRFTPPVTVTATVKEMNGFGGLLRRYSAEFWILNNGVGVESDGYGVVFSRSDALTSNSLVRLFDGPTLVDSASPTFQYGPEINVSITFNLDGNVTGIVSEPAPSTNTFAFTFGPHKIQSTGSNFSISTGCAGSGDSLFPRFDDVTISSNQLNADLALSITDSPDPVTVGDNFIYRLIVSNNGPGTATGVVLTDTLPSGVNVVSIPPSCSGTSSVTCSIGDLSANTEAMVEIVVAPTAVGAITK